MKSMGKDRYEEDIDPFIVPVTAIDKEEKQLIKAGYKVEKKELLDSSAKYLEVFDPENDIVDGYSRKVVFMYDGTGHILKKLSVVMTPYELNHDKEKRVF